MKDLVILGGPNGAGKTTAAPYLLPRTLGIYEFVNADEIARGLSPFNPAGSEMAAARLMLDRIRLLAQTGESFAFETTCAGRGHARLLQLCRAADYRITLLFLWLPSPDAALARVAQRVREGGHDIPRDVVVRRYHAGLRNLRDLYLPLVDAGAVYDNSISPAVLIAEHRLGMPVLIHDAPRWANIEKAAR